ncbi:MAG: 50S ribosomal protein L10 [bacterium]|nr:50S ribosomal protein L10 [Candidatus Margulisiibacteriota bacterium]
MANAQIIEEKKKLVDELSEKIETAKVVILSDFRGISVKDMTVLRKKLFANESEFRVLKNTLLKRALEGAGYKSFEGSLSGPTGVLLGYKDPVAPLKSLVEFFEEVEKGEVKVGIIEKTEVDFDQIQKVAQLPSREELVAKVVGGIKSPLFGLVNVLSGTLRGLVVALNAVKEQKDKN